MGTIRRSVEDGISTIVGLDHGGRLHRLLMDARRGLAGARPALHDWLFLGVGGSGFILLGWMMAGGPVTVEMRSARATL